MDANCSSPFSTVLDFLLVRLRVRRLHHRVRLRHHLAADPLPVPVRAHQQTDAAPFSRGDHEAVDAFSEVHPGGLAN